MHHITYLRSLFLFDHFWEKKCFRKSLKTQINLNRFVYRWKLTWKCGISIGHSLQLEKEWAFCFQKLLCIQELSLIIRIHSCSSYQIGIVQGILNQWLDYENPERKYMYMYVHYIKCNWEFKHDDSLSICSKILVYKLIHCGQGEINDTEIVHFK